MQGKKKCIICHLCGIRFYIKSLLGRTKSQKLQATTNLLTELASQFQLRFSLTEKTNNMVVSSFPTAHTDEPMASTATDSLYTDSFSKICSCSYVQLGILPHLPLCPCVPSHNTDHTNRKVWKSKQLKIKITNFTLFRKMRSSLLIPAKTNNSPQDLAWNKSLILLQIMPKSSLLKKATFDFFYLVSR